MTVILYSFPGSPACDLVRSLAKHLNVKLTVKNVDFYNLENRTEAFLKLNPFRMVPTLVDNGFAVYESLAIVYYLLRKYARKSELYPECIRRRTRVDQILYSVACNIRPPHIIFFGPRFCENSKPTKEEQADFDEKVLGGIQRLIGEGPFATGDTLTVADLSILAILVLSLDIGYVDKARFPDLFEYYGRVKGSLPYFDDVYGSTIRLYRRIWAQLQ
ncbi:glutathione S-transferase 2-like isoform X1 [Dermacentor variabilis]|uniref:glutathione S-transferase 2-like isoform X1 n=1 Tax=Dermacentor variabilis TaxID=34621 RepID=UPI003F5B7EB9